MDYPREEPLDVCPDLACRRSGACLAEKRGLPCEKFYMDPDAYRWALADRLERLFVEWGGDLSVEPNPTDEEVAYLYNCLREREAELMAEEQRSANVLACPRRMR